MNLIVYLCLFVALVFGPEAESHVFKRHRQILGNGPIKNALSLGGATNATRDDCEWVRGDRCMRAKGSVKFVLYTPGEKGELVREMVREDADFLRFSGWNGERDDVVIIHGYAGGDDTLPIAVLRDAYISNGSYNVWLVDWGPLARPPCYPAAVHNTHSVARCVGEFMTTLRNLGVTVERTTCVGHSLGAHICGMTADYMMFRMHRIIGLDPAKPLIKSGNSNRLDSGDALSVVVIHTNAGHYGETGRVGTVDFCVNGGRMQPFCEKTHNERLCSHVWSICYMAESIYGNFSRMAEPCGRRCPSGPRHSTPVFGVPVVMGQNTPTWSSGSYCVDNEYPPFCPKFNNGVGDVRCCIENNKPTSSDGVIDVK